MTHLGKAGFDSTEHAIALGEMSPGKALVYSSFHFCKCPGCVRRADEAIALGRAQATAEIVGWLREKRDLAAALPMIEEEASIIDELADAIERGEHIKA